MQGTILQGRGREDENVMSPPCLAYLILTKLCFILATLCWFICSSVIYPCSILCFLHVLVAVIIIQHHHLSEKSVLSVSQDLLSLLSLVGCI